MWFLYWLFIKFYFFFVSLASLWRKDARKWKEGRIDWKNKLEEKIKKLNPDNKKSIWIHVSSLGEFEQGRSLIEEIKKYKPNEFICLSFFSPSGFEIQKNYALADLVCYFPSDNSDDVTQFLDLLNPKLAIFVKYDFWFNTLKELHQRAIPYFFISMHLSEQSYLRKKIFKSLLNELRYAEQLFLQTKENYEFLYSQGFTNIEVCGDTRLDRVIQIRDNDYKLEKIEQFIAHSDVLILGSSWSTEIKLLHEIIDLPSLNSWKIIIAPHLPDSLHISEIENSFLQHTCRYSKLDVKKQILIIDEVGILSKLYKYADLSFIGGGFGKGIHNTLEAIAHLSPVCFGPHYKKFPEAIQFIEQGIGFEVNNSQDLFKLLQASKNHNLKNNIQVKIECWIKDNRGATNKIFNEIKSILT
ncbi:MAG: glycosyltransferase N-terminal domain-containing protein [Saprospiraceae bacterium]